MTGCQFPFSVTGVPPGASAYTVTVAGVRRTFTAHEVSVPLTVRVTGRPSE